MPKINLLSPHVADLIAAGEVVERPGSVIKELVENSIDAGADIITIEIRNGGMTYMRVTDNGCGMAPDDAETAFLRHATSKLRDERGLESIGTLGFRGEALAAISAVSRINMMTRETSAETGTEISLEGGIVVHKRPVGCPVGTTIIVQDLFFNTPARLKFMKSDRAEGANVSSVVMRCALSHPEVSIRYIKDGKEEYHTPGDGRMDSCAYSILGRDFAAGLLEVNGVDEKIPVHGYVTAPVNSRGNRGYQFFFINGRFVKSKTLQTALEQAYKNSLFTGKYPGCILYIDISFAAVDVNVHPTKTEVKFLNEKQVFDAVFYSVLAALESESKKAEIVISPATKNAVHTGSINRDAIQTGQPSYVKAQISQTASGTRYDIFTSSGKPKASSQPKDDFFKTVPAENFSKLYGHISERGSGASVHESAPSFYQTSIKMPLSKPASTSSAVHQKEYTTDIISPVTEASEPMIFSSEKEEKDFIPASEYRIIGEAMTTYIIVEKGSSLFLIDKHAAHERMLFDKLKSSIKDIMSQQMFMPFIYETDSESCAILTENSEYLEGFGFEIDSFGENKVALRSVPADMREEDLPALLSELAESLSLGKKASPDTMRDNILHSIACRAAVKAGKNSPIEELFPIAEAVMNGSVKYCPHGRPVAMEISKSLLDKNFKRI